MKLQLLKIFFLIILASKLSAEVDLSNKLLALYHKSDGVYTEGKEKCVVYKKSKLDDFNQNPTIEQREQMLFNTLNFVVLQKNGAFRVYTFFVIDGFIEDNSINSNETLSLTKFENLIEEENEKEKKQRGRS